MSMVKSLLVILLGVVLLNDHITPSTARPEPTDDDDLDLNLYPLEEEEWLDLSESLAKSPKSSHHHHHHRSRHHHHHHHGPQHSHHHQKSKTKAPMQPTFPPSEAPSEEAVPVPPSEAPITFGSSPAEPPSLAKFQSSAAPSSQAPPGEDGGASRMAVPQSESSPSSGRELESLEPVASPVSNDQQFELF